MSTGGVKTTKGVLKLFVGYQDIYVHYCGEKYHIWVMSKRDKGAFGELGGEPGNFRCELTAELERVEVDRGAVCRWDSLVADTILKPGETS